MVNHGFNHDDQKEGGLREGGKEGEWAMEGGRFEGKEGGNEGVGRGGEGIIMHHLSGNWNRCVA